MDIQHLKYAVEVERSKSISKAAEKLYVSQPFLSKAIKELEYDVGIEIFNRSSRGVYPTRKGEEFLARAKEIIASVDELSSAYRVKDSGTYRFEVSVPIACYISRAFVEFAKELEGRGRMEVDYRETGTMNTIGHVESHDCNIGVIRYQADYEDYYLRYAESKDIIVKPIWQYEYHLVMSKMHPLAGKDDIDVDELRDYIEISHGDPAVPSLSASAMLDMKRRHTSLREIVVYERQSQFELLCELPNTYMWASPTPEGVMNTYPIVEKRCSIPNNRYTDALIYRKGYRLSPEDRLFIKKVEETARTFKTE